MTAGCQACSEGMPQCTGWKLFEGLLMLLPHNGCTNVPSIHSASQVTLLWWLMHLHCCRDHKGTIRTLHVLAA